MQAVILAGGLGTRLWPLTIRTPKPLLPVMGRPLLAHLLERLPSGVDEVFLAVSFEAHKVQKWVAAEDDPAILGRRIHVVMEDPPLGTGGALANLRDTKGLGAQGAPVLVLNGDLVSDMDLDGLVVQHDGDRVLATIALVEVEDPSHFGIMELDPDWRIRRFVEKPAHEEAPSKWANAGAYVLDGDVLGRIASGRRVSLEREVFPVIAGEEPGMRGRPHRGLWVDCGTRESYLQAHEALMAQDPSSSSGGGCFFGPGVKVAAQATLERCVLHEGVVVGRGARVVASILGAGAVVGAGCVVERSIVGAGASVRDGTVVKGARLVGDSE